MTYEQRPDGSIKVPPDFPLTSGFLKKWKQDKVDPQVFYLRWVDCPARSLQVLVMSCGRTVCQYNCTKFGKPVSPSECDKCLEKPVTDQLSVNLDSQKTI